MPSRRPRAERRRLRRSAASTTKAERTVRVGREGRPGGAFWQRQSASIVAFAVVVTVAVLAFVIFQGLRSGEAAGDFRFSVYQGQDILGGRELMFSEVVGQGKPVVLNFWAGDCPPCRAEMPAFQRIYEAHQDELLFLGLDVGIFTDLGTRESALALLEELNVTYPIGTPPTRHALDFYQVTGMPSTVFFGSDGRVFRRWVGGISEGQMNSIVDALLDAS